MILSIAYVHKKSIINDLDCKHYHKLPQTQSHSTPNGNLSNQTKLCLPTPTHNRSYTTTIVKHLSYLDHLKYNWKVTIPKKNWKKKKNNLPTI